MPIIGLTTNIPQGRGFPKIGNIYKGSPKNEKGYTGKDLDYFRVEFEPQYQWLESAFIALYGEKPKLFTDVRMMGNDTDEVFPCWYEAWNASQTLLRRCDGSRVHQAYDEAQNQTVNVASQFSEKRAELEVCYCENLPANDKSRCSRVGRLNLYFFQFFMETGVFGRFQLSTGSIHDILNIYSYLQDTQAQFGNISNLFFEFGRRDQKVNIPVNGERRLVEKSLLYLQVNPEQVKSILSSPDEPLEALQLSTPPSQSDSLQLESGDMEEDVIEEASNDWATDENLFALVQYARDALDVQELNQKEMALLVGILDHKNNALWNETFPTGQEALNAIQFCFRIKTELGKEIFLEKDGTQLSAIAVCVKGCTKNKSHAHARIKYLIKNGLIELGTTTVNGVVDAIIERAKEKDQG